MRISTVVALAILTTFLLVTSVSSAAVDYDASWHVIAAGGGRLSAGTYTLDATIGQSVAGVVQNEPYDLCAGFWCSGAPDYRLVLPLILRGD